MHTFTFKVINKNLTASTLLVQYTPDDENLSPIVQWIGVPEHVLAMSLEDAKEEVRKIIILCAPQAGWDTELAISQSPLIGELDDMIGADFPVVGEDEIATVMAEATPKEDDE